MVQRLVVVFLVMFSFEVYSEDEKETPFFISSEIEDIDKIRKEIGTLPTTESNAADRRAALYRWWRFMWRQGMDMSRFDSLANLLINNQNDTDLGQKFISEGFQRLEEMWANPIFIQEINGSTPSSTGTTTNWPVYHGVNGSQSGFSPDQGAFARKSSLEISKDKRLECVGGYRRRQNLYLRGWIGCDCLLSR